MQLIILFFCVGGGGGFAWESLTEHVPEMVYL